jgi:probable HAF family extracellular repeat protein
MKGTTNDINGKRTIKASAKLSFGQPAALIPILCILTMMTIPAAHAQVMYSVTDLGTLGGLTSSATCINNSGQIAGDADTTNITHAFLYSGGNMTDLGSLEGGESHATSINSAGQVVGYASTTNASPTDWQAFLYTAGTMTGLGSSSVCSLAYGINDSGQVVGECGVIWMGEIYPDAFLFSGKMAGWLGTLGGSYSGASSINNSGQIVGWSDEYGDNQIDAFLWTTGVMTDLGTLAGSSSYATCINNNGQVAGYGPASSAYTAPMHAFLWSSGIKTDLGTLGGTNSASIAYGINNSGQVVGISGGHAFLYSGGNMTDLNSRISSYSGWTLLSANGINDSGEIVGQGINPSGMSRAFLLVPNPHRATATATLLNGSVAGAAIMDGGWGYGSPPTVLIQGGGGTGATATAVVSNGMVVSITITDAGTGYTNTPSIYIYSPLGLQIGLIKAVTTSFSDLLIGTNYQLQVSSDLSNWTNQGSPFTATNPALAYPQYWNVDNWNQLFFRLQVAP